MHPLTITTFWLLLITTELYPLNSDSTTIITDEAPKYQCINMTDFLNNLEFAGNNGEVNRLNESGETTTDGNLDECPEILFFPAPAIETLAGGNVGK
ncbi:hypothetical protein ILUMI_15450 [Ignelater luminosus]|uniref:Uncharacterized protein n=1 Tax=Ignelater luminosus TaxID=2038154 RepID=A0A8K0CNJ8_IGNLU|nr:hypothetical protein ILUMI_15450 [Ignelater luminosus]